MKGKIVINCTTFEQTSKAASYYNYKGVDNTIKCLRVNKGEVLGHDRLEYYLTNYPEYTIVSFTEWEQSIKSKTSNMKYVVEVNTLSELNAVKAKAGLSPYFNTDISFPWAVTHDGDLSTLEFFKARTNTYGPILSFKDWALMLGVKLKPNKTLKLTNDYNAIINYTSQIVEVGCQKIAFDVVTELAKLIVE